MSPSAAPPSPQEIQRKLSVHTGTSSHPPLTSLTAIVERRSDSGEDTEDEEDAVEGGWKTADVQAKPRDSIDESVIKAGYLWKKGERRKVEISLDFFSLVER